ncbi:metallophosphoesterase family protein [uncultured Agrobacterium sp.]|uniref:metallophosphoesterase family protein n=1 Tax=uncultured Agrobacterium sp. TaxID=157277 RepID=UPI0025F5F0E0|nr:metallophosphoesterase family protein [uncultured Agrobacterium sp.]
MVLDRFRSFVRSRTELPQSPRAKLIYDHAPAAIYAIGDVHGRLDLLQAIEDQILSDAAEFAGEKWIVMLGDYVDRGPKSTGVIDHLLRAPPAGFLRICLAGNHEELMASFLENPGSKHPWLDLGGFDTLRSYGISPGQRHSRSVLDASIPSEHREFITGLPSLVSIPGYIFVHAGVKRGVPLQQQLDRDLLWMRPTAAGGIGFTDAIVVHGHTPVQDIEITNGRINVDTAAYATNKLSAIRISNGTAACLSVIK